MKIIGKVTINPALFFSGKICGYITWFLLGLSLLNISLFRGLRYESTRVASLVFLYIGLLFVVLSLINLGKSTRLGLPSEDTLLKINGIYRYSRNPMYLGFNLITLASIFYNIHMIIVILGVYSIIIYHAIIQGEEKFLEKRFGKEYLEYKERTRRYF